MKQSILLKTLGNYFMKVIILLCIAEVVNTYEIHAINSDNSFF